ncbi:MAG TPA: Ig-like domain-containing protein, partial [Longimicrobiales bacterium]|nr:Ig-like domain-containing protein [Longimicrobiales bacterium]
MSPRMRLLIPTATAALALALVQACTTRNVTEVDVGSVEVQPAAPTVAEGATVQLNATVRDDHGAPIPQAVVAWSSDDDGIATVDDNGRATGTGAGTTTIRASFQGVVGTATITVEPGPSIHAIPDSVSLFGSQGSSPTPVVIQIENGGVGTLSGLQATVAYEGSANGWLPVSLAGTTAPTTLSLTAVTAGLAVGDYRAVVAVTGNAGNSPLEIPVRLSVTEDAPIISLAPSSLTIEGVSGRAPPGPVLVQVTNAGGGSLSGLSPSVWYSGSTAGWLSASIASPTAPTQLSVTANASSLPPGTYRGEVRVAAPVAVN